MSDAATRFADALAARDIAAASALLDAQVDFRAMTPNRIWEATDPAGVADVLRAWLEDPDEEVESVTATGVTTVEDVTRVGWVVRLTDADGAKTFEQQAYVRDDGDGIAWMRVMCSGSRVRAAG